MASANFLFYLCGTFSNRFITTDLRSIFSNRPIITIMFIIGLCGAAAGVILNTLICRYCKLYRYDKYRCYCKCPRRKNSSAQLFIVCMTNAFLWGAAFAADGFCADFFLSALAASDLLVLSIIDIKILEIPPQANIFLLLLGIIKIVMEPASLCSCLLGFALVPAFLFAVYFLTKGRGIGGGDIKLMAAAGLFLGFSGNITALFFGCLYASVIQLFRIKFFNTEHMFAMGPYLAAGILTADWFGSQIINWYITL